MEMNRKMAILVVAAVAVAVAATVTADRLSRAPLSRAPPHSRGPEANGAAADLVRTLRLKGVRVWLVSERADGDCSSCAYIVDEDGPAMTGQHLSRRNLPLDPGRKEDWAGVAKAFRAGSAPLECVAWGDCGLEAGGWAFFGDPNLLGRIRHAL
jgi:hypothetical protein